MGTPILVRRRASIHTPAIAPFGEPTASLLFGGETLAEILQRAAADCGVVIVDVDRTEVFPPDTVAAVDADVLVNGAALGAVLARRGEDGPVQGAVAAGSALWWASARLTDVLPDAPLGVPLWVGNLAGETFESLASRPPRSIEAIADDGATTIDVRPYGRAPHVLQLPAVKQLLGWPRHWVHVLDLSLAACHTRLASQTSPRRHTRQTRPKIHPSATVHNCILGDNVVVEAHVSLTDAVIGNDVLVGDHSVIHTAVIGDRCRTLVDTHLRRVVAMPGSTLSNLDMQDAVFGSEVFLTTGVAFFHDGPGHNVEVDGVDSGRAVLNGAIGRRAVMGSRALFRCGLALPAGALIVARPEEAIGKFDAKSLSRAAMRIGDRSVDV